MSCIFNHTCFHLFLFSFQCLNQKRKRRGSLSLIPYTKQTNKRKKGKQKKGKIKTKRLLSCMYVNAELCWNEEVGILIRFLVIDLPTFHSSFFYFSLFCFWCPERQKLFSFAFRILFSERWTPRGNRSKKCAWIISLMQQFKIWGD